MPSLSATWAATPEWLAPVSSTRRNGPFSLIHTGAQILPIRSRSVGATKRGSGARTTTSDRSSCGSDASATCSSTEHNNSPAIACDGDILIRRGPSKPGVHARGNEMNLQTEKRTAAGSKRKHYPNGGFSGVVLLGASVCMPPPSIGEAPFRLADRVYRAHRRDGPTGVFRPGDAGDREEWPATADTDRAHARAAIRPFGQAGAQSRGGSGPSADADGGACAHRRCFARCL